MIILLRWISFLGVITSLSMIFCDENILWGIPLFLANSFWLFYLASKENV